MIGRVCLLLTCILMAGCLDGSAPPELLNEGEPCDAGPHWCEDDEHVLICTDREWVRHACKDVCEARGLVADGCSAPGIGPGYHCQCRPASDEQCMPGLPESTRCADADTLESCGGDLAWHLSACTDVCEAAGLTSAGCLEIPGWNLTTPIAKCYCSFEDRPCPDEGEQRCAGPDTLATCTGGTWSFEDCTGACGGKGTCLPLDASCGCTGT